MSRRFYQMTQRTSPSPVQNTFQFAPLSGAAQAAETLVCVLCICDGFGADTAVP